MITSLTRIYVKLSELEMTFNFWVVRCEVYLEVSCTPFKLKLIPPLTIPDPYFLFPSPSENFQLHEVLPEVLPEVPPVVLLDVHIGTESTTEGLQARTSASRPIRFQQSSQQPNLIGLEALVRACSPSVVLSVPLWIIKWHYLWVTPWSFVCMPPMSPVTENTAPCH